MPEKQTRQKSILPGLNQLVVEEQNLIQLVCCVAVHFFSHMRVDVERGADIAMTESALDRLDVNAMPHIRLQDTVGVTMMYDK